MGVRFLSDGKLLRSLLLVPVAVGLATVAPGICRADVVTGGSQGYGAQVEVGLLGISIDLLDLTPGQVAQGTAPTTYTDTGAVLLADVSANTGISVGLGGLLSANIDLAAFDGTVASSAASNVDGNPGQRFATATGGVNDLQLGIANAEVSSLLGVIAEVPFLTIQAGTLQSTSTVSGDFGALTATGESMIQNLDIKVGTTQLDLETLLLQAGAAFTLDAEGVLTVGANTTLLNLNGLAGLDLTLNKQVTIGDESTGYEIQTTALSLSLDGVPLLDTLAGVGVVNGGVGLGYSSAYLGAEPSAVPEPGTMAALALLGCGAIGKRMRARRRCVATSS